MRLKSNKYQDIPTTVALSIQEECNYPDSPPYSPSETYPEYPFALITTEENAIYRTVRKLFLRLGYDTKKFGTKEWNPLGKFVRPGQSAVIKPNLVLHRNLLGEDIEGMITHPSLIRVIVDYLVIALKGTGTIIIGDAPIQSANFAEICRRSHLDTIVSLVKDNSHINIRVEDFRREITERGAKGEVLGHKYLPDGNFVEVNLQQFSYLAEIGAEYQNFRVTSYDKDKMLRYHNAEDHRYVIHKSILEADVVISLPKLKSHRKAGLTCCLKNSVGINCQKDCLPHHRKHSLEEGGDAYRQASLLKRIKENIYEKFDKSRSVTLQQSLMFCLRVINRLIRISAIEPDFEGSWYGNDTVWRTILDINTILFFADSEGMVHGKPQRNILYLVDGIIAGEGEGPLEPHNRHLGLIAAGENPLAADLAICHLIGFDYTKIPSLSKAVANSFLWDPSNDVNELLVCYNNNDGTRLAEIDLNLHLEPSAGWKGHIERSSHL